MEEYIIKLPGFYTDGGCLKLIMQELNECFLRYKNEYNLTPDVIIFCGKHGKNLYNIAEPIFNSVYSVKYEDKGFEGVIFRSGVKAIKRMVTEKGTPRGGSISGMVVPGFCAPNTTDFLSFSYTEDRDVETVMEFSIKIL